MKSLNEDVMEPGTSFVNLRFFIVFLMFTRDDARVFVSNVVGFTRIRSIGDPGCTLCRKIQATPFVVHYQKVCNH